VRASEGGRGGHVVNVFIIRHSGLERPWKHALALVVGLGGSVPARCAPTGVGRGEESGNGCEFDSGYEWNRTLPPPEGERGRQEKDTNLLVKHRHNVFVRVR